MSFLRFIPFFSSLFLLACGTKQTSEPYSEGSVTDIKFTWHAPAPTQAYEKNDGIHIKGWTHRRIDSVNNTAYEHVTQCYPGGIMFRFEKFFSPEGIWVIDAEGNRYGGRLLEFPGNTNSMIEQVGTGSLYLGLSDDDEVEGDTIRRETDNRSVSFSGIQTLGEYKFAQKVTLQSEGSDNVTTRNTLSFSTDDDAVTKPDWVHDNLQSNTIHVEAISDKLVVVKGLADGRNVLGLLTKDGWVVFGTPLAPSISKLVIAELRKVSDRPITHAFLSHAHSDHFGGLSEYIQNGTTTVISESSLAQLPDDLKDSLTERLTYSGVLRIELGRQSIEFHEVPNSHAAGHSLAYLPNVGIIYQGDFLTLPRDGTIRSAAQVTREMFKYLKENNLSFSRMIGHHEHANITPDMLTSTVLYAGAHLPKNIPTCDQISTS